MKKDHNNFHILNLIEADTSVSQIKLLSQTKLNVTSVNFILKNLIKKGFVTKVGELPMSTKYYLTPEGMMEKKHLAYNFYREHIFYYIEVRNEIKAKIVEATNGIKTDIAIYGTSERSEITYMVVSKLKLPFLGFFLEESRTTNEEMFGYGVQGLKLLNRNHKCLLLLTEGFPTDERNNIITKNVEILNLVGKARVILN